MSASLLVTFILLALFIMPVVFLFIAVRLKLTPLNAVCLALLTSTAFSSGFWALLDGAKLFKDYFCRQLVIAEKQLKEHEHEYAKNKTLQAMYMNYSKSIQTVKENFNDANLKEVTDRFLLLFSNTMIFLWHLFSLGLIYSLATYIGPQLGFKFEPFPAFKDWSFDWNLVWLYIFGLAMYFLIGSMKNIPGAKMIQTLGANCFIISNILYLIIGFSLLFFMYDKYKIDPFTRLVLSLIALIFSQFTIWLGLIDVWAEFRLKKTTLDVTDNSDDDDFFDY